MQDKTVDYVEKKGRVHFIPALAAAERLEWEAQRQQRMIDAEDRAAAKALGWELTPEQDPTAEDEAMKQTVLGDLTTHNYPQAVAKGLGTLAATLLGASVPTAALAGAALWHLFGGHDPQPERSFEDESVQIGLGKIEDYFPPAAGAHP